MLQRNKAVLWREFDGEAVLLNPALGCSYNLNRVGTLVWNMLDGQHPLADIATAICEAYDVEQKQVLLDVEALLADLGENDLISGKDVPAPSSVTAQDHVR